MYVLLAHHNVVTSEAAIIIHRLHRALSNRLDCLRN